MAEPPPKAIIVSVHSVILPIAFPTTSVVGSGITSANTSYGIFLRSNISVKNLIFPEDFIKGSHIINICLLSIFLSSSKLPSPIHILVGILKYSIVLIPSMFLLFLFH